MDSSIFHVIASKQAWPSSRPNVMVVGSRLIHCSVRCVRVSSTISRRSSMQRHRFAQCSIRTGVDSNSPKNKNTSVEEVDPATETRRLSGPPPDKALTSTSSRGLVLDLGLKDSWDCAEIGSPVVKRYIGDDEERWCMWYHGRSNISGDRDSIGLATSSNGIRWSRGEGRVVRSCGEAGMVMECRESWWAFDTESIRPSELVVMSSPMYSSVYWLYYTGYSSHEMNFLMGSKSIPASNTERSLHGEEPRILRSLPGLACSQDGRHWARIEGDQHSGALLDVGSKNEWDSPFIGGAQVVMHGSDDLRMYYHSFDREKAQYAVGYARSRDGIRWVKRGKIEMGGLSSGSHDELGIKNARVVRNGRDGTYLMAYEAVAADGRTSIGMAASEDGLKNWSKLREGSPLETSGTDGWDNWAVGSPCLVPMEGQEDEWRMYYVGIGMGGRTGIGMAISEGNDASCFRRWSGISA